MLYCPKCLNSSMSLESKGVVFFTVNGKHQDSSRILFNVEKNSEIFEEDFKKSLNNFMKWYLEFKNRAPITEFSMHTNNFRCDEGCHFTNSQKFSIINILITSQKIIEIVNKSGEEHGIEVNLKQEDLATES